MVKIMRLSFSTILKFSLSSVSMLFCLALLTSCGSSKTLTEADLQNISEKAQNWAQAFSGRQWDSLSDLYATSLNFNGKNASSRAIIETKRKFFTEKEAYRPSVIPSSWVLDSVVGKIAYGSMEVEGHWNSLETVTKTRVQLAWALDEAGKPIIIKQNDEFGADAGRLFLAFNTWLNANSAKEFHDSGQPNFDFWNRLASQLPEPYNKNAIFFAPFHDEPIFWVTDVFSEKYGSYAAAVWEEGDEFRTGLMNGKGKMLIPPQFETIGNINAILPGMVEVRLDGKKGLYRVNGNVFLPCEYDQIWPVYNDRSGRIAWVEKEGKSYAIGYNGQALNSEATAGQSPEDERPGKSAYLASIPWNTRFNPKSPEFETIPLGGLNGWEYLWDLFITPSFLEETGLFPNFMIANGSMEMGDGRNVTVDSIVKFEDGSVGIFALFESWGIGGRESYHNKSHRYVKLDAEGEEASETDLLEDYESDYSLCSLGEIRHLSEGVIEVLKEGDFGDFHEYPTYAYFKFSENGEMVPLASERRFPFTAFRPVDESYFKGCFIRYATKEEAMAHSNGEEIWADAAEDGQIYITFSHMPLEHLDYMVNEIYASYGYKFKKEKWKQTFQEEKWYQPRFDAVDDLLSPMDSLNIATIRLYQAVNKDREAELLNASYHISEYY